jgi:hypothetical protein
MTERTLKKLREAFLMGCTDVEACLYCDISHQTLYEYQKAHPEYAEQKAQWKENPVLVARKCVVESLSDDKDLSLKYLERKRRDEFGLKQDLNIKGNITVTVDKDDKECL